MISQNLDAQVEPGCGTVPSSDSLMETLPWYGNNEVLESFISEVEDIINGSIITIIDGLSNVRLTQSTNLDQTTIDVSSLNNGIYYLN